MIHVESLVKTFGDVTAVDAISFDVHVGEIFAFLGPNGAGKTTTIQMLTTLLRPTSGRIAIDGIDPVTKPHDVRRRFGIVFQDPSLDGDLTAFENMELHGVLYHVPRRIRVERIEMLLRLFELWDRRNARVKEFSGGMKRRLEIARALLHTPKILFLDEPTLGLDPQSRNHLWTHVRHLNETEGVTVFLTTHYMDEAERVAHRIAVIDHGRIVAQGSPQELKQQNGADSLEQDRELLKSNYGITNLVARASAKATELTDVEFHSGAQQLLRKVKRYRPQIVAILGIGAFQTALKRPKAIRGRQPETFGAAILWVLPNPSGLNAHYQLCDLVREFRELKDVADR